MMHHAPWLALLLAGPALAGSSPIMVLSASCPGEVQVSVENLTPSGDVAIARADVLGSFTIPSGPCIGTVLDIGPAGMTYVGTFTANPLGIWSTLAFIPPSVCGEYAQAIDLTTCETSDPVEI